MNTFPVGIVRVGKYSYGPIEIRTFGAENESLEIGMFVSIGEGVKFILSGEHCYDTISTYPFKVMILNEKSEARSKGPIVIGDDVWVGMNAMILSGVNIGRGAVIGAGTVISKDVPPYAVVVGNPARVIKYRFDDEIIGKMKEFSFESIDDNFIKLNIDTLYSRLNADILSKILISLNFSSKHK